MKKKLFAFVAIGLLLFAACEQETNPTIESDSFEEVAFTYFDNVSQYYPDGDVKMTFVEDENGIQSAEFELIGESKENSEWGSWAARTESEDGTTCDGAISCGKALKKCLDNDQKGVIKNGACFSADEYCVTCEDE